MVRYFLGFSLFFFACGDPKAQVADFADRDGDGHPSDQVAGGDDCNDDDPLIHPGADEICDNGVDNNCDGIADLNSEESPLVGAPTLFLDADDDGFGTGDAQSHCEADGWVVNGGDCNDTAALINPGATEECNRLDDNCNNEIDEGTAKTVYYVNLDGDDYGDDATAAEDCSQPPGTLSVGGDCMDDPAGINGIPGDEIFPGHKDAPYDDVDQDCAGDNDWDDDGDGHDCDPNAPSSPCKNLIHVGDDCDDTETAISPSATEKWYDGVDSDCSGGSDYDQDGDGDDKKGFGQDCDDTDPTRASTLAEVYYNGLDENCDDDDDDDSDGDGVACEADYVAQACIAVQSPGYDCDDANDAISPEVDETPYDGVDQDCDGWNDYDLDHDGYVAEAYKKKADDPDDPNATATDSGDCDDSGNDVPKDGTGSIHSADIHPGASDDAYDGIDADCNGLNDYDADEDGFVTDLDHHAVLPCLSGGCDSLQIDCDDTVNGLDKDINGARIPGNQRNPGMAELWYDGVDQDCDEQNDFDQDLDGYVATAFNVHAGGSSPDEGDCQDDPDDETDRQTDNGTGVIAAEDIYPRAKEPTHYNGVDENCDGWSDYDADEDGWDCAKVHVNDNGTCATVVDADLYHDCNDADDSKNQDAYDEPYQNGDENCNPYDDDDKDGDGVPCLVDGTECAENQPPGYDCDDSDDPNDAGDVVADDGGTVHSSQIHPAYDHPNPNEPDIEADETAYNGIDEDCSGIPQGKPYTLQESDYDVDQDGYLCSPGVDGCPINAVTEDGDDCQDGFTTQTVQASNGGNNVDAYDIHPEADDTWYDGIDANCDEGDDFDQDGDGSACLGDSNGGCESDGGVYDCADDPKTAHAASGDYADALTAAQIHPDLSVDFKERWYDGIDQDCDGLNDFDQDLDGYIWKYAEETGGQCMHGSCNVDDLDCYDDAIAAETDGGGLIAGNLIHPGATETWYDGVDQDCLGIPDGATYTLQLADYDQDEDGYVCEFDSLTHNVCPQRVGITYQADDLDCADGVDRTNVEGDSVAAASINPGAQDAWYDGVNQDCGTGSDFDKDGDGQDCDSNSAFNDCPFGSGDDCHDETGEGTQLAGGQANLLEGGSIAAAQIFSGASDTWYDGVDQNCDQENDFDQDHDGFVTDLDHAADYLCNNGSSMVSCNTTAADCNELGSTTVGDVPVAGSDIHPGANETWYDGVDQSCHLRSDFDRDGDTFDCNPNVVEDWNSCPEIEGVNDGPAAELDCFDNDTVTQTDLLTGSVVAAIDVNPDISSDPWYDGVDWNCDLADDFDQDGDGFGCDPSSAENDCDTSSGADCNDDPSNPAVVSGQYSGQDDIAAIDIHPNADERWYDAVDQDCDQRSDFDQDNDGFVTDLDYAADLSCFVGDVGQACNTQHADCNEVGDDPVVGVTIPGNEINANATEVWYDGVDQDCDGQNDYDQDGDGFLCTSGTLWNNCALHAANVSALDCHDDPTTTQENLQTNGTIAAAEVHPDLLPHDHNSEDPDFEDTWYNGVDEDCGGNDDFDQDGDGFGCDPANTDYNACTVSGNSSGNDCADDPNNAPSSNQAGTIPSDEVHPDLIAGTTDADPDFEDSWYDGIDQDCSGNHDWDKDGDGFICTSITATNPPVCAKIYMDPDFSGNEHDCDDEVSTINPGADEIWYDGHNQSCKPPSRSDYDQDNDGYSCDSASPFNDCEQGTGDDCDDSKVARLKHNGNNMGTKNIHPGAADQPYDGIDQDCDNETVGSIEYDKDDDGVACSWVEDAGEDVGIRCLERSDPDFETGMDCDDTNATVSPDVPEDWYNGIDNACDGGNDYDQDGDGYTVPTSPSGTKNDCNDTKSGQAKLDGGGAVKGVDIHPEAVDEWWDGVDANCDGAHDYDKDEDLFIKGAHYPDRQTYAGYNGVDMLDGKDCNDSVDTINPDADEIWYDGINQSCKTGSDYDKDVDGYCKEGQPSGDCTNGGEDCNDKPNGEGGVPGDEINPGADEVCRNEVDDDCDGWAGSECMPEWGLDTLASSVEWATITTSPPLQADMDDLRTLLAVADVTGDGQADIVLGDESFVRVFQGPLGPGTISHNSPDGKLPKAHSIAVNGDYDDDIVNDLVFVDATKTSVGLIYGPLNVEANTADHAISAAGLEAVSFVPQGSEGDGVVVTTTGAQKPAYVFDAFHDATVLSDAEGRYNGAGPHVAAGSVASLGKLKLVTGKSAGTVYVTKPFLGGTMPQNFPLDETDTNQVQLTNFAGTGGTESRPYILGAFSDNGGPDLAVANPQDRSNRGTVALSFEVTQSGQTADVTFKNQGTDTANQYCGLAVASGDLNGDGHEDLVLSKTDTNQKGSIRIFWGPATPGTYNCAGNSALVGDAGHQLGQYLAVGDVTGDSVDDIVVAAPGANTGNGFVYIINGHGL
jgi:hypothetical protein